MKTPLGQVAEVKHLLMNENARNQLAMVAARHMNPERMMRIVANAIRTTPKLAQCQPMSVLGALMQCAALGLEPNTVLGHAYMIPFDKKAKNKNTGRWEVVGTEVQLIIGYKGLIDLARRSGHITSISANIHRADDELWEYEEGTEATLRHRPGPQAGAKLHAYAIAKFKDGGHAYVVLPWAKVMEIRNGSQGWQQAVRIGKTAETPWGKHEDEMAKKTAIRALAKYLPLSTEFMDAVSVDESRANYQAFAFDPTMGVAPVEDDAIEGEAEAQEPAAAQIEQKQATPDPAPQEPARSRARQPAPKAAPRRPEPETHAEQSLPLGDPETGDISTLSADEVERLGNWTNTILADLEQGAAADEVRDMWGPQIDMIEASAPDLYAKIKAAMEHASQG